MSDSSQSTCFTRLGATNTWSSVWVMPYLQCHHTRQGAGGEECCSRCCVCVGSCVCGQTSNARHRCSPAVVQSVQCRVAGWAGWLDKGTVAGRKVRGGKGGSKVDIKAAGVACDKRYGNPRGHPRDNPTTPGQAACLPPGVLDRGVSVAPIAGHAGSEPAPRVSVQEQVEWTHRQYSL